MEYDKGFVKVDGAKQAHRQRQDNRYYGGCEKKGGISFFYFPIYQKKKEDCGGDAAVKDSVEDILYLGKMNDSFPGGGEGGKTQLSFVKRGAVIDEGVVVCDDFLSGIAAVFFQV